MELKLESLPYQDVAIQSVVKVFEGTEKNDFDNACFEGIRSNVSSLSPERFADNVKLIAAENGVPLEAARFEAANELCIEMETGTGKTLVYVKTIFELSKHFGFTKFIILVPSIAIRQGVLGTFNAFGHQLEKIYGFTPNVFEYDGKKLSKVTNFIEEQHPQVMVMTLASFNSDDKILNQAQREDLFANIPYIEALGKTRPVVIMDEPQEGMDTPNSIHQIGKLNPLVKIRYSATHKVLRNLLYRLTPFDSYKQGLVKKIEVLTVTEKNDEATLKIELAEIQNGKGFQIKAKLRAWHQVKSTGKFEFKPTGWLQDGDNLGEKTNNPSYLNFKISRVHKSLRTGTWSVTFSNGVELQEKQKAGSIESVWALQLEWLIHRHFAKSKKLKEHGIKCLSLIFIDRVANYVGETPVIKNLFTEKFNAIYPEYHDGNAPADHVAQSVQGYYFAQKANGEFADNEGGVKEQNKIYDLILRGKEELLTLDNPVQFIFSHSALGVGWDNPNVFNIATLNAAYSDIRKRQEIGRGLRICVNQDGQRVYDAAHVEDRERINQLTVIPNETYETFVVQYQDEIKTIYGTTSAGAAFSHSHKGESKSEVPFRLNRSQTIATAFRSFWNALARKTNYTVVFDEESLIRNAVQRIGSISIPDYLIEASSHFITELSEQDSQAAFFGSETYRQKARYSPLDLVEELSENTGMSYPTTLKILQRLENHGELIKNPPRFLHETAAIIRNVELEEMIRGLDYQLTDEIYPFNFDDFVKNLPHSGAYVDTPNRGVFDKMLIDSDLERLFARSADLDSEVVCFLKLPAWYKIKTPIGDYEPDFGLVLRRKNLLTGDGQEHHFVVEIKGTNSLEDKKALTESEIYKIRCAMKHFAALGMEVHYEAPVREYPTFKNKADSSLQQLTAKV